MMKSIQSQLIMYFAIAIVLPALITCFVGVKIIQDQIIKRAESKTISDLNSAREIYRNNISHIERTTNLTAARTLIIAALAERNRTFLQKDLPKTLTREKLDVLTIVDANGIVICRGRNPGSFGDTLLSDKFIRTVIQTKRVVTGTDIVPQAELMKESPALVEQAKMETTPTPKAHLRTDRVQTDGMMQKAAVPVFDDSNVFRGVLLGGILLNRNFEIVDKIKDIVHEREIYDGREIGTATIFQNDLRISTNVLNQDRTRAIATLVSDEVRIATLDNGQRFVGEAFVVNAWYIAAYEPIRDIDNRIIGILFVGVLRQPFDDILLNTLATFLGIAFGGIALVIILSVQLAKKFSRPLKELEQLAKKVADGEYHQEIAVKAPLEIEQLASSLNQMAKELAIEKHELEEWGNTLEKKVQERSDEIKKIHSQLFRSEKLASLGKLAAGVAHEINNPLTGILTNSSLLLEDIAPDDPRYDDVKIIVNETIRCREIVKRLLDFAKQSKPQKKTANVNTLIENIILLVRNQASFRNIRIEKHLAPDLPEIQADTDQIQQVFINIILNAAEAMVKSGLLTVDSALSADREFVEIRFQDTGPGIPPEHYERIFDPFFTTKEQGTGLGLSISYGIIEQHGGTINVDSVLGKGTCFTIQLPAMPADGENT